MEFVEHVEEIKEIKKEKWYCYILRNNYEKDSIRTYNGKTNDLVRRLKEHNQQGPKTKGALYTRKWGNKTWEYIAVIGYFPSDEEAQRHEWRIKKPEGKNRNKKYVGPAGRIKGLNYALSLERFTSNCENLIKDMELNIWILEEYADLINIKEKRSDLDNLNIISCKSIDTEYIKNNIMINDVTQDERV